MEIIYLVLFSICAVFAQDAPPVRVTVFYECLCGDSHRFIDDQFYPTFTKLKDIMEVDTNAFGKANSTADSNGGYTFICQHGEFECQGNIMIGCAKKYIPDLDTFQDFNYCVMNSFYPPEEGKICADQLGVDFTPIDQCATSIEGQTLLHELGEKQAQLAPDLNYVPWIIINDVWTQEQQDAAEFGLLEVVCEAYTGNLPEACAN
ncbi:unnamed protein product [Meganyctiphanes norvegica]|uniref:Gamma-interferon-inducible lysosomal thiol reductase n=1 Tax=Meganyctiphanes norvegica TaxID=48144 RepID=A0AAV2R402_MEGNR